MSDNFNKNRIAKNSILLYTRMLFTMWLNLYTTRLVLANLGVEDMGVYGVVGSIVGLFSVFSIGITYTVQRFITFELGKVNGNTNSVFCTSLNIIFIVSALVLILLESGGLWFLWHRVNIPQSSMEAAFWVYQLSVFTCIVGLVSIPYNALVIAHEKMDIYALFSIVEVVLTCLVAYCLSLFSSNRLLFYAVMMAVVSVIVRVLYQIYCSLNFKESRFHFLIDRDTIKEMGNFAGVSTFSGVLYIVYSQGLVLVLNWIFGVALNAVYSIALQLKNSILSFAYNVLKAISPQIIKTYANGEIETHKKLVYSACKLQIYMLYLVFIPFVIRAEYIIHLWLGNVPLYMVEYGRITVFMCIVYALFEPIRTAVNATGKIVKFTLVPDVFYLLSLLATYILTLWTHNPIVFIISVVAFDMLAWGIRIYYALDVTVLEFKDLFVKVIFPSVSVAICGFFVCFLFAGFTSESIIGLLLLLVCFTLMLIVIIYIVGVNKNERILINTIAKNAIKRYV